MSPFAKFLALLLVAFLVYVLWPRTPDLTRLNPAQAAKHEAAAWQSLRAGNLWGGVKEYYLLFDRDLGFSPVRAFTLAQQAARAQMNVLGSSEPEQQETSVQRLIEHYAIFKRDLGSELDAAAAGRSHFNTWVMVEAGNFSETLQEELLRLYGQLFAVEPRTLRTAVTARVEALREAFAKEESEVDWKAIQTRLESFYEGLPIKKAAEEKPAEPAAE
jgi:hypothetical protein